MFYIEEMNLHLKNGKMSSVKFEKGLNIIYGPSNTGKSMLYNCLDYMMGGTSTDRINKKLEIMRITLTIDNDGKRIIMSREMGKSVYHVTSESKVIESGEYQAGGSGKRKKISDLWFKLMGIQKPEKVLKNLSGETQNMSIRSIYHLFMIDEDRIQAHKSIMIPNSSQSEKMHTPTLSSLVYLTTGDSLAPKTDGMNETTLGIKNKALQNFVDASMLDLDEYQDELGTNDEAVSPVQIQNNIDDILYEISSLESNLSNVSSKRKEISDQILALDDEASENKILHKRYKTLQTQYVADIKRLTIF